MSRPEDICQSASLSSPCSQLNISFPWTDLTTEDCQLPDVELIDGALGLVLDPPDPTALSDPSDGTYILDETTDIVKDADASQADAKDALFAALEKEDGTLRESLNDRKDLLPLVNRQKAELKALRKRLAAVEVDRKYLRSKVEALKTVIVELEADEPVRKRPRSNQPVLEISAPDALHRDLNQQSCLRCAARDSSEASLHSRTELELRPTLGTVALQNWLRAVVPGEREDVSPGRWSDHELLYLERLQRSPSDVLSYVSNIAAAFHRKVLNVNDAHLEKKLLQRLAQLSRRSQSKSVADELSVASEVFELLKVGVACAHVSESVAIQSFRVLFQGYFTGAWNICGPLFSLATFLRNGMSSDRQQSRIVLIAIREQVIEGLRLSQNDPICDMLAQSLSEMVKCVALGPEGTARSTGSQVATGHHDSEINSFCSRCRCILTTCLEAVDSLATETCCLALSLECTLQPPAVCHDIVLNKILWPAIQTVLQERNRFWKVLQLVGCVGSRLSKEKSIVTCKALKALLRRLSSMLFVTKLHPQMRAAVVDAIVSIVHLGEEEYQESMISLEKWGTQESAAADLRFVSPTSAEFLRSRKNAPLITSPN